MQITVPTQFITLGGRIRYLAGAKEEYALAGESMIIDNLKRLRSSLAELGFTVSCNLFDKSLAKYITQFEKKPAEDGISAKLGTDATLFAHDVIDFEKTVGAEALTRTIALPIPRRISLEHLLREPEKVLGAGVFDMLSPIAQGDIRQACKCIAFECPTAAAFHILRCTEECVRLLYGAYFPRKKIETQTWGHLTTELAQRSRNPKPDATLLAHLDHLRNRFRNPTDHPEKVYEIEEAEDLLHVAVDAMNRCMRDARVQSRHLAKPDV